MGDSGIVSLVYHISGNSVLEIRSVGYCQLIQEVTSVVFFDDAG